MRDILSFKEIAPLNLASIFLSYHFYETKSRKRRHKKATYVCKWLKFIFLKSSVRLEEWRELQGKQRSCSRPY